MVPVYKVGFCMSSFCSAGQRTQEMEGGQEEKVRKGLRSRESPCLTVRCWKVRFAVALGKEEVEAKLGKRA